MSTILPLNPKFQVAAAIIGARMHYAVPIALLEQERLERFYTDWYSNINNNLFTSRFISHAPFGIIRRVSMRYDDRLPLTMVKSFPLFGIAFSLALRLSHDEQSRERMYVIFGRWFGKLTVKSGFGHARAVYGINTTSKELFEGALSTGKLCILEQCSSPYVIYKKLFNDEYELWPDWVPDERYSINSEINEREIQEWKLANVILCGSQFVKDGLSSCGVPSEKCRVVPYTVDVAAYKPQSDKGHNSERRLRILFLGNVSVRKGIQYVYEALGKMHNVPFEAQAAGWVSVTPYAQCLLNKRIQLLGLVPRNEIRQLLNWADVLVLPSICEGSALVTYEALASGVPVITTPNSGSPVQDEVTGFIVPYGDSSAIAARLEQLAVDLKLRYLFSQQARKYAEENLSWSAYTKRLLEAVDSIKLSEHNYDMVC